MTFLVFLDFTSFYAIEKYANLSLSLSKLNLRVVIEAIPSSSRIVIVAHAVVVVVVIIIIIDKLFSIFSVLSHATLVFVFHGEIDVGKKYYQQRENDSEEYVRSKAHHRDAHRVETIGRGERDAR